jgi:hypothetical protein
MKHYILFLFIYYLNVSIQAQTVTIFGTEIILRDTSNATPVLFVSGSLTVSPTGKFKNYYSNFQITGDITNHGIITSTGTEIFSGITHQTLIGNFSGFSNLGIIVKQNNGSIILSNNLDCQGIRFNTPGTLDVSQGTMITVKNPHHLALLNYSSSRFIDIGQNGKLVRSINDTLLGHDYSFPIGNTLYGYRNINISITSLGTTGSGFVSVELKPISGSIQYNQWYSTGFSQGTPGICNPGNNPQWVQFSCITQNGWRLTGPDYTYTVLGDHPGCGFDIRRLIRSPTGTNQWTENISTVSGDSAQALCRYSDWTGLSQTIPGGPYRDFDYITVAGGLGTALPVTLLFFKATPGHAYIQTEWSTAMEINNERFIVERSIDAIHFTELGTILGNGTTTEPHHYSLKDFSVALNTTYYYRLVQQDYDGQTTISEIVSVEISGGTTDNLFVFPNPTQGSVKIRIPILSNTNNIYVTDIIGQKIGISEPLSIENNLLEFTIFGPSGVYLISLTTPESSFTSRIIKY